MGEIIFISEFLRSNKGFKAFSTMSAHGRCLINGSYINNNYVTILNTRLIEKKKGHGEHKEGDNKTNCCYVYIK